MGSRPQSRGARAHWNRQYEDSPGAGVRSAAPKDQHRREGLDAVRHDLPRVRKDISDQILKRGDGHSGIVREPVEHRLQAHFAPAFHHVHQTAMTHRPWHAARTVSGMREEARPARLRRGSQPTLQEPTWEPPLRGVRPTRMSGARAGLAAFSVVVLASACSGAATPRAERGERPTDSASSHAGSNDPAAGPTRMTLDVGHCWVEPVKYDGERWGLAFREQFGWGGPQYYPENWTGTGILQRVAEDQVQYTDDGGAELMLLPADAPSVARVEDVLCR